MVTFKQYEGVDELSHKNMIREIQKEGLSNGLVNWVLLEHIKGPDFSIWLHRDGIKYARGNSFLTDHELYFNYKQLHRREWFENLEEYHRKNRHKLKEGEAVVFYGVLIGTGNRVYPTYSPVLDFVVQDIRGSKFTTYENMLAFCDQMDMHTQPQIKLGKFVKLMRDMYLGETFDTIMPREMGRSNLPNNEAYAIELRPVDNVIIPCYNRRPTLMRRFGTSYSDTPLKAEGIESKNGDFHIQVIQRFLNDNRVRTIATGMEPVDKGKLISGVFSDALKTYQNIYKCNVRDDIGEESWKKFQSYVMKRCEKVVEKLYGKPARRGIYQ